MPNPVTAGGLRGGTHPFWSQGFASLCRSCPRSDSPQAQERTSVHRRHRILICLSALLLVLPATALAGQQPKVHVDVSGACVGDIVSGRIDVRAPIGTKFTLRLQQRRNSTSRWRSTTRSQTFKSTAAVRRYKFRFDVSRLNAFAYRLAVDRQSHRRTVSRAISAASCAPGLQVPEAPAAILLPLSLLGAATLLLLGKRAAR
jgi:hypothetical protein